jgi:hypothetical protein
MTSRSSQTRIERGMPSCAASYLARAGHVLTHAMSEGHETTGSRRRGDLYLLCASSAMISLRREGYERTIQENQVA